MRWVIEGDGTSSPGCSSSFSSSWAPLRLVLEDTGIAYAQYGFAAVKAMVLAKVILIEHMMHLGADSRISRWLSRTCCQTLVFSLFSTTPTRSWSTSSWPSRTGRA